MDWGSPEVIFGFIAIGYIGWTINNWIRAKHGYPLENEWGGQTEKADDAEKRELREINKALNSQLDKMQDRMVVLEKIVTDRGYTLSEEIEALRDRSPARESDTGVPLSIDNKERA